MLTSSLCSALPAIMQIPLHSRHHIWLEGDTYLFFVWNLYTLYLASREWMCYYIMETPRWPCLVDILSIIPNKKESVGAYKWPFFSEIPFLKRRWKWYFSSLWWWKTERKDAPSIKGIRESFEATEPKIYRFSVLFLTSSQCQHFDLLFTPTYSRIMLDRLSFNSNKENPLVRSLAVGSNRNERGHLSLFHIIEIERRFGITSLSLFSLLLSAWWN